MGNHVVEELSEPQRGAAPAGGAARLRQVSRGGERGADAAADPTALERRQRVPQ